MKAAKRKKLEAAGWKVSTTAEFLGLSPEEEMLVDIKLGLTQKLKARRIELKITQQELARRIGSSQSRVAKMEVADGSASIDLLIRALAALGESQDAIGKAVGAKGSVPKMRAKAAT